MLSSKIFSKKISSFAGNASLEWIEPLQGFRAD
jgi:hypothetical protein